MARGWASRVDREADAVCVGISKIKRRSRPCTFVFSRYGQFCRQRSPIAVVRVKQDKRTDLKHWHPVPTPELRYLIFLAGQM
jgi:hypothetical protein